MVSADSAYRTFLDIKTDIRNQIFTMGDNIQNKTYQIGDSAKISGNITKLYNNVQASRYKTIFNDNVTVAPSYSIQPISMWNVTGGNIKMDDGITISYNNVTGLYNDTDSTLLCDYLMYVQVDMNIYVTLTSGKSGHYQSYNETYVYSFTVDSGTTNSGTAISNLNGFFQGIANTIQSYT
ncbi:hypothetical protein [Methanobacterium sp. ACI-7]|uniref:hypothetical protein n=1 Tax=unclassified Methanobacterium TaxID=2627676 RepID=UPI0039C4B4DB